MAKKTKILGSKQEALTQLNVFLSGTKAAGAQDLALGFITTFLNNKIRFPVLEFMSERLYNILPERDRLVFTDTVISARTIGGNVVAGKFLQLLLAAAYDTALNKAEEYILFGDAWYVCDIIGERVMGHALLTMPVETMAALREYSGRDNKWMPRCVGVATHYAVKKGLAKIHAERAFKLLLDNGGATGFHTKKGIGWAAKTVAKFHPDIISKHSARLDGAGVKQWFKSKVKTGLGRSFKYATRGKG